MILLAIHISNWEHLSELWRWLIRKASIKQRMNSIRTGSISIKIISICVFDLKWLTICRLMPNWLMTSTEAGTIYDESEKFLQSNFTNKTKKQTSIPVFALMRAILPRNIHGYLKPIPFRMI